MSLPDDLTALVECIRLQPASAQLSADVAQAQLEVLLARIAALTEALRNAPATDSARFGARLLLADLALVTAQFRGRTNAAHETLTRAIEGLGAVSTQSSY
jgi:hypothetical protein